MSESPLVLDLAIDVKRREVDRRLGYRAGSPRRVQVEERLRAMWEPALALLAPRGAFRIVEGAVAFGAGMPAPAPVVAVALCTIGPALESESSRLAGEGDLLGAVLLDAFGSAAAEAAAESLNAHVRDAARPLGLAAAPRISPGYGTWDVRGQGPLLGLLPAGALGVTLTPGFMMIPRKSVSFAANLVAGPLEKEDPACSRCGRTACEHRVPMEPEDGGVADGSPYPRAPAERNTEGSTRCPSLRRERRGGDDLIKRALPPGSPAVERSFFRISIPAYWSGYPLRSSSNDRNGSGNAVNGLLSSPRNGI